PYANPNISMDKAEEQKIILQLLGEIITSELLYAEAINAGIDKRSEYRNKSREYADSLLADMYKQDLIKKKINIDERVVKSFAKENGLSVEAARAVLHGVKKKKVISVEVSRLFDEYGVKVSEDFAKKPLGKMKKDSVLAESKTFRISLGELLNGVNTEIKTKKVLLDLLLQYIEVKLLSAEALKTGIPKKKDFVGFLEEYKKSLAINMQRENLRKSFKPRPGKVDEYLRANGHLRYYPQRAEVLMIVTKTEKEAWRIRKKAVDGANFYQLAIKHSIAPNSRINAGSIGEIHIGGRPYTAVEKALLKLKPGEISEPVKGLQGHSIFKLITISERKARPKKEQMKIAEKDIIDFRLKKHIENLAKKENVELLGTAKELHF
ncbi:MAG: peptidylprolyl isomerase, partial [Nitrospinota bacterium]